MPHARDINTRYESEDKMLYTLTRVEKNVQLKVFPIISLYNNNRPAAAYIYPNPLTGDKALFTYRSDTNERFPLDINVIDIHGREIYQAKITVNKGKNQLSLPLTDIVMGVYFLKFENKEHNIKGIIKLQKT